MLNYKLVDTPEKLDVMVNSITNGSKILACDSETTALKPKDGKLRLIQISDTENTYIVDLFKFSDIRQLNKLGRVFEDSSIKKIIHNSKFEYAWFLDKLGVRLNTFFDTYLGSILCNFDEGHKLSEIVRKYIGVDLSKAEQKSDWSGELTESQLQYAADDVLYLHQIREMQIKKLQETSQLAVAKLEFDTVPVISEMELRGFAVDVGMYSALVEKNLGIRAEKEKILLEFLQTRGGKKELPKKLLQEDIFGNLIGVKTSNDINVRSHQQVLPILREMGIPIESTDQKYMGPLALQYPDLDYLIEFRDIDKLCGTYGDKLLAMVVDGRLYGDFFQIGAITGRMSAREPNLQNQPRTYDFRSCYRPKQGRKLYISDFSQIEIRILADFSKDSLMLETYAQGKDIHSMTGAKIFNLPYEDMKEKHKTERQSGKTANLSIMYGISPQALTLRLKKDKVTSATEEYSEMIINGFYSIYPGAKKYLTWRENNVLRDNTLRTLSGRLVVLDFDRKDRKSVGAAQRAAKNFPIQGTSADITKLAMTNVHKALVKNFDNAWVVNSIHDELAVEHDEKDSEEIKQIVDREMVVAGQHFLKNVKVEADGKVCDSWGDKA